MTNPAKTFHGDFAIQARKMVASGMDGLRIAEMLGGTIIRHGKAVAIRDESTGEEYDLTLAFDRM